jgi:tetratricopeptide (TPR) repeat protein
LTEEHANSEELYAVEMPEEPQFENLGTLKNQEISIPTFWQKLRRFFFASAEERREDEVQRLRELNDSIERFPQAAVNYLLRGEWHLEQKQYDYAQEDFTKAIELAAADYERDAWGLSAQVIADRARHGLEDILRYS